MLSSFSSIDYASVVCFFKFYIFCLADKMFTSYCGIAFLFSKHPSISSIHSFAFLMQEKVGSSTGTIGHCMPGKVLFFVDIVLLRVYGKWD